MGDFRWSDDFNLNHREPSEIVQQQIIQSSSSENIYHQAHMVLLHKRIESILAKLT